MTGKESDKDRVTNLLKSYSKGLTIEEVSKMLSVSRATAAKYLNNMVLSGTAELRELGRAKLFYLTKRLPLTNLLSLASDLILILDNELFIQEMNEQFLTFFRRSKDELKGLKIEHSPLATYFTDAHLLALNRALEGESNALEILITVEDTERYFKMKLIPLVFEAGDRAVGILLEDITEMKKYQQDLEERVRLRTAALIKTNDALQHEIEEHKKTEAALLKNDARLKRAEEVANFGNWEFHLDSNKVILSDGARVLYGTGNRELSIADITSLILEEYRPVFITAQKDLVEQNNPYNIEFKIRHPSDGSIIMIHAIAEYDPGTHVIFGVIHDVSDQKQAEDAIRKATKQIMLLNSVTRHDILNQLNTLTGYMGLVKKLANDDRIREMNQQEELIADTIRRQITFTRDYQNIGMNPPQWTNVERTITKALATADLSSAELDITTGTLELYSDLLIEKVYFNLVDNSIRHGGHVTRMSFGSHMEDSGLTLIYEDDGTGIPDEDKMRIFERGFGKNTGYGLFLVKEILSITGFTIRECGTLGKGARFEIFIPKGMFRFPR
jgi:PAS domain S-box-containing protein